MSTEPEPTEPRPRKKRGAGTTILASLLVPALAFVTTLPTWIQAHVPSVLQTLDVDVPGTQAAPAVSALALVALAGVLAVRIAGPVLRAVICAVIALAGAGIAAAAVTAVLNPEQAALETVGTRTGTVGAGGQYEATVWPWLTLVLAAATVIMAVVLWFSSRRWSTNRRRYERAAQRAGDPGQNPHADDIDAWDSLSQGDDPTDTRPAA